MTTQQLKTRQRLVPWIYDLCLYVFTICLDIFFREIYPRAAWKIPKRGPLIIVAAPHVNQFVDSVLLMRILKSHANRRVSFLIAEKSMREPYIGTMAGYMGALPVARAMDNIKSGKGTIYLPEPDKTPTLVGGVGTDFTNSDFMVGGSIVLPYEGKKSPEAQTIAEILGSEQLRLKNPFKAPEAVQRLTSKIVPSSQRVRLGSFFKVAPHIDQSKMFSVVSDELSLGGCIGIFPEGGSHDRSDLLPLKAGVAIMALEQLARNPKSGLSIIPCGMNYFHAHKFRSRAVIEFGDPIEVHPDQIAAYEAGGVDRRSAVGSLLETVYEGLAAVTQLSPDHDTLILVQATRRLYNSISKKLPLSLVVEFNRRLLKGYTKYQDDPRVIKLKRSVIGYNRRLRALGIKDHQIEWGDVREKPWWLILGTLLYRILTLLVLGTGTLPGLILFWPVFVITKVISLKKQRRALAGSVVKLRGRDVVGTWKILVAMGLAPSLYSYYTVIVTTWLYYNRNDGYYSSLVPWWINARVYIPDSVPLWLFSVCFFALMISVTFAALRIGETGMDVLKSLPPLLVALNPGPSNSLIKLRAHRQALSTQVTDVINTLGPEIFPDFEADRVPADSFHATSYQSRSKSVPLTENEMRNGNGGSSPDSKLSTMTTPPKPLEFIDSEKNLGEMNQRTRAAIEEWGQERARGKSTDEDDWTMGAPEVTRPWEKKMNQEIEGKKEK